MTEDDAAQGGIIGALLARGAERVRQLRCERHHYYYAPLPMMALPAALWPSRKRRRSAYDDATEA